MTSVDIPFHSIEEWDERFDEFMERVEGGETMGIYAEGHRAVMVPIDSDFYKFFCDHNDGC